MVSFKRYQTKSGSRWMFKVGIGADPITGERRNTTRSGFKMKREAQEKCYELELELELEIKERGNIFKEKELTLKKFCGTWLEIYENERYNPWVIPRVNK